MAYSFRSRLDYMGQRKKEVDSVIVTVTRGETTGPQFLASEGVTTSDEITDRSPGVIQKHHRDWICDKLDYKVEVDGDPVLPETGDIVTTVETSERYELCEVSGTQQQRFFANERCFSYTSATKKRLRLHSNQISLEV